MKRHVGKERIKESSQAGDVLGKYVCISVWEWVPTHKRSHRDLSGCFNVICLFQHGVILT
jgi:hypothetical protein